MTSDSLKDTASQETQKPLVLASTSKYRAALLKQIGLNFTQIDPKYQEIDQTHETAGEKALRLSVGKAKGAIFQGVERNALVIGCDQVAHLDETIFNKPGNFDNAFHQLQQSSGQWVSFTCGLCLLDSKGALLSSVIETYEVKFRALSSNLITRYLHKDSPYDCAGSIKAEALGIALLEECRGKDINTLYGLPLIALVSLLSNLGISAI